MSGIDDKTISAATYIVRSRLNNYRSLSANIIDHEAVFKTSIDKHYGIYRGFFFRRAWNNIAFIIFRSLGFDIMPDKVIVFYTRYSCDKLYGKEANIIRKFAPGFRLTNDTCKVVNVKSAAYQNYDISILTMAIEKYLTPGLFNSVDHYLEINIGADNILYSTGSSIGLPNCAVVDFPKGVIDRLTRLKMRVLCISPNEPTEVINFHVLIVLLDAHLYYLVKSRRKVLNLLICHDKHFEDVHQYNKLTELITERLGEHKLWPTRIVDRHEQYCSSDFMADLILLSIHLNPNFMFLARPSDAESFANFTEFYEVTKSINTDNIDKDSDISSTSHDSDDSGDFHLKMQKIFDREMREEMRKTAERMAQVDPDYSVDIRPFGETNISPNVPSTSSIDDDDAIEIESSLSVESSEFPHNIITLVLPRNDPNLDIFSNLDFVEELSRQVISVWNMKSSNSTKLAPMLRSLDFDVTFVLGNERFYVQMLVTQTRGAIVVIDQKLCEWVVIDSNNHFATNHQSFNCLSSKLIPALSAYGGYTGRAIKMSCHFHQAYPLMHLIMGLHTMSDWLHYGVGIPLELIYTEQKFRHLIWKIHHELNRANESHNVRARLVDQDGVLLPEAYRSHRYYLAPVPGVVKEDQCPYCLVRNMRRNMANHIRMKHGIAGSTMANKRHANV